MGMGMVAAGGGGVGGAGANHPLIAQLQTTSIGIEGKLTEIAALNGLVDDQPGSIDEIPVKLAPCRGLPGASGGASWRLLGLVI